MRALIIADDALADLGSLWSDAVEHLARKLGRVVPLDPEAVPAERAAAVVHLDAWAGTEAGNWRVELARFYEGHAPVHLRPDPELNSTLRQLSSSGVRITVWSPGPPEALAVITHFLGLDRQVGARIADADPAAALRGLTAAEIAAHDAVAVSASPGLVAAGRDAGAATVGALWTGGDSGQLLAAGADRVANRPSELL
jgi:phosphoglycolate phosphatase-like HAD superfamily hydrolase